MENTPSADTNIWDNEMFSYSLVRSLSINGVIQYQSTPMPNYIHNYVDAKLTFIKPDGMPCNFETNDKISLTITTV